MLTLATSRISGISRFGFNIGGLTTTLSFVALARRSIVDSWECLQSTPTAIAVILHRSQNLETVDLAARAANKKKKKKSENEMDGSRKDLAEEEPTGGLHLYQEYRPKESEKAASAANSSASRYSNRTSAAARAGETIQIQSNQDGQLIQEVKKEMGRGTSKVKPGSLHTTAKSGLADASGETNLTKQTAVAGNMTLHEETAAVVSKTSPVFDYTVSERAIKEETVDSV